MKQLRHKLVILVFFITSCSYAQQKFSISGTVKDSASGEVLSGVNVIIKSSSFNTLTNAYGFFSITVPEGEYTVTITYLGYKVKDIFVKLNKNIKLDVELPSESITLGTVEISGQRQDKNVTSTQMSTIKMDIKQIKTLPVLFGEVDILKTITMLPGIQTVGEGNGGIYVRGGGPDQNLILLDEANVYNPSHLLGFFSVFNSDAVKDITVYKAGMPAKYGGRLSSVIDIRMNDGNNKKISVKGGIGLISSRLTIEIPIVKNKGSFMISGRRTYADFFLRVLGPPALKHASLYFYDLNMKANYRISYKDQLFLSGYFGQDVLGITVFGINWGNYTGTLRWNHVFNDKLFWNTSLITSNYNYGINIAANNNNFGISSSIRDYNIKTGFEYSINDKNKLTFGASTIYHIFTPGNITTNGQSDLNNLSIEKRYAFESAIYVGNEQTITKKLSLVYGLRYSIYDLVGPGTFYSYDSAGAIKDSIKSTSNKIIQQYAGFEPRISARYQLDSASSIKASYTRTRQYLQQLQNTTASNPTSLWIPSSNNVLPQICDQYALGYFRNFKDNKYEASVEIYYKNLQNQIDYKPGADLILNPLIESQLYLNGKGRAYGVEFYLKKSVGKFTGWISYTLSRTERKFTQINNDNWYPATQNRTNNASIVLSYELNAKWIFSTDWVYATGNAVTFPVGKYEYGGQIVSYYSPRNAYTMPAYNRMDVSATYRVPRKGKFQSDWNFSIYNVYDRHNAYAINFQADPNNPTQTQAVKTWLFGIIPAITYNFKF